jgi:hypothetical protein
MVVEGMIRRVCWYLALVVLTGAVVVWLRCRHPNSLAPYRSPGRAGGIVLNERNFDLSPRPATPVEPAPPR